MNSLLVIGFIGGLITGISPCVIPVVPVIAAGGSAGGSRRRPFAIIGGMVASFSLFTLVGGSLLSYLDLPADFLRNLGLALLFVLALGLLIPKVGELLAIPFSRLGLGRQSSSTSGLVLGMSLGLVFVPCAGPVLAAISVVAATHRVGWSSVVLTVSYAAGAAVPLLVLAIVAQRSTEGFASLRDHAPLVRRIAGGVLALAALALALNLTRPLQTSVPGYTSALEDHIESSPAAEHQLQILTGERPNHFAARQAVAAGALPDLGVAPQFTGITAWLHTPGGKPLSLSSLAGKVVLVDFWTYSCINCERSLPHVEAWYRAYRAKGLVVIGVHTPEFAFEHVVGNVATAADQLGVDYPIAIDSDYATWNAYANEYWPAEYLIDQHGHVRHMSFGEGDYATTEADIRTLLAAGGATGLGPVTNVADLTPTEATTPETYLGDAQLNEQDYVGSPLIPGRMATYRLPATLAPDDVAFGGRWDEGTQSATAGSGAALELNFTARDVYLVLGGSGTVTVSVNGARPRTVTVAGIPGLHTLVATSAPESAVLRLSFSPGVSAYDFTFG